MKATMATDKAVAEAIDAIQQMARQNIEGMDSASQTVAKATDFAQQLEVLADKAG